MKNNQRVSEKPFPQSASPTLTRALREQLQIPEQFFKSSGIARTRRAANSEGVRSMPVSTQFYGHGDGTLTVHFEKKMHFR